MLSGLMSLCTIFFCYIKSRARRVAPLWLSLQVQRTISHSLSTLWEIPSVGTQALAQWKCYPRGSSEALGPLHNALGPSELWSRLTDMRGHLRQKVSDSYRVAWWRLIFSFKGGEHFTVKHQRFGRITEHSFHLRTEELLYHLLIAHTRRILCQVCQ